VKKKKTTKQTAKNKALKAAHAAASEAFQPEGEPK